MNKWTPENVVSIKREIERLQKERADIVSDINGIEGEKIGLKKQLENIEADIERRRELLTTLDESVSSRHAQLITEINELKNVLNELSEKKKGLENSISILQQGVNELRNIEIPDTTGLQRSIIKEMNEKIENLLFAAKEKTQDIERLDKIRDEKKIAVDTLEDKREELMSEKIDIQNEIIIAKKKHEDILHSLERSENQIKDLLRRERDVSIKERRLTPEYQRVFNKVNRTKK